MGLSTLRKFYAIARAGGYYCGPAIGHLGGLWVEDRLNAYVLRFPTYGRALARIHHEGFALTTVGVPAVVEEVDVKQAVLFEEVA